jgi:PAS domain S-box-containing protein
MNIFFIFPFFKGVLIKDTEDIAQKIARHFSRDTKSFNNLSLTPEFASEAKQLKEEFNLEKLRVFSETGIILYSSDTGEIGMINEETYFRDKVSKGITFSQLVKKDNLTFEGRVVDADVVETYVPVMKGGRFIGAIEVYYDITFKNQVIVKKVLKYSLVPFFLMFFLLIVVLAVLLKAEKASDEPDTGGMYINYLSPLYLLLITAVAIFSVESIVMLFLSVFPPFSPAGVAILDSSLLIMIVSPVLYFYLLRPLKLHIAERKRMEDVVRQSEEKYRSLVETTNDSIYLVDRDYKYLFMNMKHISRMGLTEERVLESKYGDFHSPEDNRVFAEYVDEVMEKGESTRHEHVSRRDGHSFLRTLSPVKDPDGSTVAVNVISTDITSLKHIEYELTQSHRKLKELSRHQQAVREQERTRVAREVHDELGQSLTALKMDASWLYNKMPEEQGALKEKAETMKKNISATIQSVKRISSKLRPSVLDHFGLAAAVEWEAKDFKARTGIVCRVSVEPEDISLDDDSSTAIYRILQEALTNITRHAFASTADIVLKFVAPDSVMLIVSDNGTGITNEQVSKPESFGLMGIRERIDALDGEVNIEGAPGRGTTIKVIIPFNSKEDSDAEDTHSR